MKIFSVVTALTASLLVAPTNVSADDWADQIVKTKKIDFGVIATGSEAKKYVEVKNIYDRAIHISDVRTTCGCSAAAVGKKTLEPGETSSVEVKMNTSKFRQRKDSNLIISFDRPRFAEVRVPITAYIRTDVVFTPGSIKFGNVDLGEEGKASVDIAYAGRSDWDIVNIKITNQNLKATLTPKARGNGRVDYRLDMILAPSTKAGRIRDLVQIVTNDTTNPFVPLMVEGTIVPDITITPAKVAVRPVSAGQSTRVQIVVKGKKPFKIDEIDCEGMEDCFHASIKDTASSIHIVPIEFNAPNRPGKFSEELIVKINGRRDPLKFSVSGTITN